MTHARTLLLSLTLVALLTAGCQHATTAPATVTPPAAPAAITNVTVPATKPDEAHTYVFGWGELPVALAKPRGGSSRGADITLAPGRALPLPAIAAAPNAFARDRAAILALAGDYRTSFHFMEALGFAANYAPQRSYHSWATEHVRVIADTGRFISLQHTLVMFFKKTDGTTSEPMLTKHWRQDWTFEPTEFHTFRGADTWARRKLTTAEAASSWTQSVWQVDDSPRYSALGRWDHAGNRSVWTGDNEWRPLPRREHTVRKDYSVMEGSHRIVLTPTGWLHEQMNWKRVAGEGSPASYVGEEWGLDRYERITAPALTAADDYWKKTGAYWAAVRQVWTDVLAKNDRFALRPTVNGQKLFEIHFAYTEKLESGTPYDPADGARHARATIESFLTAVKTP